MVVTRYVAWQRACGFLFEIDVTAFYFPSSQKLYDTAVALARQPSRDTCADTYTNVTSALSMPSI